MTPDGLAPDLYVPPDPRDTAALDRWLAAREVAIGQAARAGLRRIVTEAYEAFVSSVVASADLDPLDAIPSQWAKFVEVDLGERIGGMYLGGTLSAWIASDAVHKMTEDVASGWTSVVNHQAVDYMDGATNRLAGVGNDVWWKVRAKARTALSEGWTNEKLKGSIEDVTAFSEFRADTIARTETVAAYNAGGYEGSAALGEHGPVEKAWMATNDARTRPSHRDADGQTVPFAERFNVGGVRMLYPLEAGAPADEVVNCRCVAIMLYAGDKRPDGSIVEPPPSAEPPPPPVWEPPAYEGPPLSRNAVQPSLGGAHEKIVLSNANGEQYLFKPMERHLAHIEAAASDLAVRAGLSVPRVHVYEYAGRAGSLQRMIPNARNGFPGSQHAFDPSKVTKADLATMQQHRVLDWLIGNHDAHAGQWVRSGYATSGGTLTGIDKGQAFRWFGSDRLDYKYHPNSKYGEALPVHNAVEQAWAEGRLADNAFDKITLKGSQVRQVADRLQSIPDDDYRAMLRPYAQGLNPGNPGAVDAFLDAAVARKNALVDDFTAYHRRLQTARTKSKPKPPPKPKPLDGDTGGPRGMAGVTPSRADTAWMHEHDSPLTDTASNRPVVTYSGGSYSRINGNLRSGRPDKDAPGIRRRLGAVRQDFEVYRGTTIPVPGGGYDVSSLQGAVLRDRGFMSTSAGVDRGPAFGGQTGFRIRVNAGTVGSYIDPISTHRGEREFLLDADTYVYVHKVRAPDPSVPWESRYRQIAEVEVVSKEWVAKAGVRVWNPATHAYE